ncbi:MAG TPA: tRNA pseudouridine(55) synthase TruB [Streptosporangiaceae bacterium]|nr:tRNA pseudouridine(55) synthase TruB [Streptosporangiaceae bacterium]
MTTHVQTIKSDGRALVPESGLVIVAKAAGMTSHDVVARMRKLAGTKRVGHAGTLDPMATGVLVIGIEKATRLLGHLALTEKAYTATIRLGQSTVTDDAEGDVLPLPDGAIRASDVSTESLRSAIVGLTGEIEQVPPKVSAIKVNGQRAYHLTRTGAAPELKARTVTVWRLDLLGVRPAGDLLDVDVDVTCSSGTYIRAIARDLGAVLGTGGHLTALERRRVGPYTIDGARTLEQLAEHFEYIPLAQAAAEAFPSVRLDERETWLMSHGVKLAAPWRAGVGRDPVALGSEGTMAHSTDPNLAGRTAIAAFGPDGSLIALVAEQDGELQPLAVFVP